MEGNASITVETETIVEIKKANKKDLFSYVQIRGSPPLVWKQTPDLNPTPKIHIFKNDELNCDLMKKNFAKIEKDYKSCTLVNLLGKMQK